MDVFGARVDVVVIGNGAGSCRQKRRHHRRRGPLRPRHEPVDQGIGNAVEHRTVRCATWRYCRTRSATRTRSCSRRRQSAQPPFAVEMPERSLLEMNRHRVRAPFRIARPETEPDPVVLDCDARDHRDLVAGDDGRAAAPWQKVCVVLRASMRSNICSGSDRPALTCARPCGVLFHSDTVRGTTVLRPRAPAPPGIPARFQRRRQLLGRPPERRPLALAAPTMPCGTLPSLDLAQYLYRRAR